MTTKFIESGTVATQGFQFYTSTEVGSTGAITSDSQAVLGSVRSIKVTTGSGNDFGGAIKTGILADAGRRISIGMRFHGTISLVGGSPGGDFISIAKGTAGNATAGIFSLGLNATANLVLFNSSDTVTIYGSGSTVLSADTDYRISIVYTITSTTVNTIKVYINGVTEISVTNVTLPFTVSDTLYLEVNYSRSPGANFIFYYAHVYVDDGTTGETGNIRVTAKLPFANGTTNGMTPTGSPSGYGSGNAQYVNERPLNTANFVSVVGAGSAVTEEYNIENLSTGDVDLTGMMIIDYAGWLFAKSLLSETGQIILNNVTNNISLTNVNTLFTQIAGSLPYPSGTGTDIGIITSTTVTTVTLYECGIIIAYILPRKSIPENTLRYVRVGNGISRNEGAT